MYYSFRRYLLLFTCLLLAGLSIAGCGSSTTAATNSMTLNIAILAKGPGSLPIFVAQKEGFFKDVGLTLTPNPVRIVPSGGQMTAALESGSIEFTADGQVTEVMTLARVDSSIKFLGALLNGYNADVIVSNAFEQQTHLTEASSLADKVNALVGKKIGIVAPRGSTEALLTYLFRLYGHDARRDSQLVNLGGTPAGAVAALKAGHVDALSYFPPTVQLVEAAGIGHNFISPLLGDVPQMSGQLNAVMYAKQSLIDSKPRAVQAFVRAIALAESFIHKNPTKLPGLFKEYLGLSDQVCAALAAEVLPDYPTTPRISQQAYDLATQFHVKAGLISIAPSYSRIVASSTIDSALSGIPG